MPLPLFKKMKKIIVILAIIFIACPLSGRIRVQNFLSEKVSEPGQVYEGFLIIENTAAEETAVRLSLSDLTFSERGEIVFTALSSQDYSNRQWVVFDVMYFLVPGTERVKIPYRVMVPETAKDGSYWVMVFIEEENKKVKKAQVGVSAVLRYGIQIRTLIGECQEKIEIEEIEFTKDNYLKVLLKNTGKKIAMAKVLVEFGGKISEVEAGNVYPGFRRSASFNLEELEDGENEVKISVEVGERFFGQKYSFYKGEKPKPKKVAVLERKEVKRRKRKVASLYLVLNTGGYRKGISLAGNLRGFGFTASGGSYYNEFLGDGLMGYRAGLKFRRTWFSCGTTTYFSKDRSMMFFNVGANFKNTNIGIGYNKESEIINLRVSQQLFKKLRISLYGFKSPQRNDWNCSVSIPIL